MLRELKKNKSRIPVPPDVKKLRALKDLNLESVVKKAKRRKAAIIERREDESQNIYCQPCNDNDNNESNENNDHLPDNFVPDYLDVYTSIKALDFDFQETNFPGFDLLNLRVKKDIEKFGKKKIEQLVKAKCRRWKEDIKLCNKRKRPPPTSKSIRTSAKATNLPTNPSPADSLSQLPTPTNPPTNPPTPADSPSRLPTPTNPPTNPPTPAESPSRLPTPTESPS